MSPEIVSRAAEGENLLVEPGDSLAVSGLSLADELGLAENCVSLRACEHCREDDVFDAHVGGVARLCLGDAGEALAEGGAGVAVDAVVCLWAGESVRD